MNLRKIAASAATDLLLGLMLAGLPGGLRAQSTHTMKHTTAVSDAKGAVDINTATMAQLKAVPGIGDVYAKRIIASRPYTSKDQLVSKGVLPQGVYDKVKGELVAHRMKK